MNILYKPVKIETAEQANAMPKGTFIRLSIMSDSWTRLDSPEYRDPYETDEVPFTALVPIEVEEESSRGDSAETIRMFRERGDSVRTRLVTPWEES